MSRKLENKVVKVKASKKKPEPAPEVKAFQWGDLIISCKCGHTQVLGKGVEHGIQFHIVNREDSFLNLACSACGADLFLRLVEGEKPEEPIAVETAEANESIQEESKQEQSL